ncbi:ROK family transcriptional regulator [bacterium]|nr:ROK family transcriptional regulator [bacterium]
MKQLGFSKPAKKNGTSKESRQFKQLKNILSYLSKSKEAQSIPEIAEHAKISVPTGTKLVKQLLKRGLVVEDGKKTTINGRKPAAYTLNENQFYAVGVEILSKWIHVSIVRIDLETVHKSFSREFRLEDTQECLDFITEYIKSNIEDSPANSDQIIGVGIAMRGSVNGHTGVSADYFNNLDIPLREYIENELELSVWIDNDTRALSIAEQTLGVAKGVENTLFVKVSRNLGLSIILDRNIVFGAKGYAGNFGHVQMGTKVRLCTCGKQNCLRTEVAGDALLDDLKAALVAGETSLYFKLEEIDNYKYHDILDAVLKGDSLSIQLLSQQGEILGQALGNIVNLLNPNQIVIGGEFVMVKDFFLDAIKAGMRKTGLINSLQNCEVKASKLGRYFSSRGAACMVLKNYELINY